MAITVGKAGVTGSVGNASQLIIIEQPGFGQVAGTSATPIVVATNGTVSGGDAHKFQPVASNIDIAYQGALIEPGVFTGTLGRARGYPGRLSVQNGFQVGGSPSIAPLVFRALLQDKNPSWHILGGTGVTLPAAVTVVNSQPAPGTGNKTVAADLASVTNPVRLRVAPVAASGATNVDVVAGGGSATAAITVADDLAGYDVPVALTITPTSLGVSGGEGTFTITGTDRNGASLTEVLTFASAGSGLTTAQTTNNAFMTVSSVVATGFNAGTIRIRATFSAAVSIGTGYDRATVRVEGTDTSGNAIVENFIFDDANKSTAQTGDRYFASVTKVTLSRWAGGAISITATDTAARVTINTQEEEPAVYHRIEVTRGLVPEVLNDCILQSVTMSLTAEDVLRYDLVYLGKEAFHQQNLAGDTGASARKTDASGLTYSAADFWIGWQAKVFVEGLELPIANATLSLDKQWTQPGTLGSQVEGAQPIASTFLGTLSGDVIYATQNDFSENFVDNITFRNIEVRLINELKGGFPAQLRILAGAGELTTNPVPTVGDTGQILQSVEMNLLPSTVGETDYISVIVDVPEYSKVRVYS